MRNVIYIISISLLLYSCSSSVQNVTTVKLDDAQIVVLDEAKVTEKKTVKLSDLVEDFQVVRFDNKDEAFFKAFWMYFSDNYICIRQSGNPIKLFDKSGRYLGNVGNIGQGPGEYNHIYDILLDEKGQSIYVTPIVSDNVLHYDLTGKYIDKLRFGEKINKGRIFLSPDASTLSLVHLCFRDAGDKFTGANVQLQNPDSVQYVYVEEIASNMKNQEGIRVGFNDEIWSYRNSADFPFMMTHTDTLYHYNSQTNKIQAVFTMSMDPDKKGDSFFIFNEWPHHYFVTIVGEGGRNILVSKERPVGYEVEFVNDFMGNLEFYPQTQDGYFFQNWEPAELREALEEALASGNCPDDQKEKLKAFMQTLHDNDNNLLFIGKLK